LVAVDENSAARAARPPVALAAQHRTLPTIWMTDILRNVNTAVRD
jgi:hypothetical protein